MSSLVTTLGNLNLDQVGDILAHEHVFVDLRTWDKPGYAQADVNDVIRLMVPELEKAKALGITALVECSTCGVGRRVDILKAVSEAANFALLAPTGIYREPWVPAWAHAANEKELYQWMRGELLGFIDSTGVQAGFIKLSAGDDGLTATETKILRAAAMAAMESNAVIASHTIRGRVVMDSLDILSQVGLPLTKYIWVHAQNEKDLDLTLRIASRGCWLEYDGIGTEGMDAFYLERITTLLNHGYGDQILLSHDRGWYDPAKPGGGTPRPFTYLHESFLPKLAAAGIDQPVLQKLIKENPFHAFAR
ncbi:MAG TPA: esterase [Anaerolineaceae bacterium]